MEAFLQMMVIQKINAYCKEPKELTVEEKKIILAECMKIMMDQNFHRRYDNQMLNIPGYPNIPLNHFFNVYCA